jgi:hypothetical protein
LTALSKSLTDFNRLNTSSVVALFPSPTRKRDSTLILPKRFNARFEDVANAWSETLTLNRKDTTVAGYRLIMNRIFEGLRAVASAPSITATCMTGSTN